jgi:hypothetical protein
MSYVYMDARKLENKEKVGDSECVALIRHYTSAPATQLWKAGKTVIGNKALLTGTAIATFIDGRWPNKNTGNHAALYLAQVSNGIYVMDQWNRADKKMISSRFIYRLGKNKDGSFIRPSDNADAFSVIE